MTRLALVFGFVAILGSGSISAAERKDGAAEEFQVPESPPIPAGGKLTRLEARPSVIELTSPFAYRQIILTGHLEDGRTIDVTRAADMEVLVPVNAATEFVTVSPTRLVRPIGDGSGALKFSLGGQHVLIPVHAEGTKGRFTSSFVQDVMPTMSKMGCNAGTCHGAQSGKNGFKLSLRGYDPLFDHRALTDDVEGRRFNRAAPDRSLMLMKPAGTVPHEGGVLTQPGEPYYEILKSWIADGVKLDLDAPRVTKLEVYPQGPVLPREGMKQQMAVIATYADGHMRDVTAEAFIESSNTEVAKVDSTTALVRAIRRGESTMLARYEGSYAASTITVMGDRDAFVWKDQPVHNWIDELVYSKLKKIKVQPSGLCTDSEFIRRIHLDLTGLPPSAEAVKAFLADSRPMREKREALIDELIGSPDFVQHWTNKWADLLQVNRKFLGVEGAKALREWIQKAVAENMPYDKFVYEILAAKGSTMENPPAAYHKIIRDPGTLMENTTQLFLAIRFNCNKCHDHPFERWTQDQYYETAAFLARIDRKEDPKYKGKKVGGTAVEGAVPLVELIEDAQAGEVTHDRTGAVTPPEYPFQPDLAPKEGSRREKLARWITSADNQYFAKSYVNRIWSYLLGVGLIEPVDDIRAGNPPTNPELLERLTQEFINSGFEVRHIFRTICRSKTYQNSIGTNEWNKDDHINYSHAVARRLPAEVLYDAIHRVTGSTSKLPGLPEGARAAQLLDSNVEIPSGFLALFGKPPRESACECERSESMMLGPVLNLVNGPIIGDAVRDPNNRLAKLAATEPDSEKIIREIFISVLCRGPTKEELAAGMEALRANDEEHSRLIVEYFKRSERLAEYEKTLPAKITAYENELIANRVEWEPLEIESMSAENGIILTQEEDNVIFASGPNPDSTVYKLSARTNLEGITGIRLELLRDKRLPSKGPGRSEGNFFLNEFKVSASPLADPTKIKQFTLINPDASFSQDGLSIAGTVDNLPSTGWAIAPRTGRNHEGVFTFKEPINMPGGAALTITLDQTKKILKQLNIGKFRISLTASKAPIKIDRLPRSLVEVITTPKEKRTGRQQGVLDKYYRQTDKELARLKTSAEGFPKPPLDARLLGVQDLTWALLNSKAFLFNR